MSLRNVTIIEYLSEDDFGFEKVLFRGSCTKDYIEDYKEILYNRFNLAKSTTIRATEFGWRRKQGAPTGHYYEPVKLGASWTV